MIDQLDNLIAHLLTYRESGGKQAATFQGASISFVTPDEDFNLKPAINFFLYDIRENLSLRTSGQYSMPSYAARKKASEQGQQEITLQHLPLHIDFSYLITVWGSDGAAKAREEHQLLGNVMLELARYPAFPEAVLKGTPFATIHPTPKITMLDAPHLQNIGEFWSAMKGKPKPMLHYTVTLPVHLLDKDLSATLIKETNTTFVSLSTEKR
jgi:hypothetical protein